MSSESQSLPSYTEPITTSELSVEQVRKSLTVTEKGQQQTPLEIARWYFATIRFCRMQSGSIC